MEEQNNNTPRSTWNLMIGISIVLLGSLRLYNRMREESNLGFWSYSIIFFIAFGAYLIFRHFLNRPKD